MDKESVVPIPVPRVGDEIYVPSHMSMSHGHDDVLGGLARVTHVKEEMSGGLVVPFVSVAEHSGGSYNWEYLALDQERLKEMFGDERARPDPDDRPEFNRW